MVGAGEVPCAVDDTCRFRGEEVEETTRQVETLVRASRALVHDCGSRGLPIVGHDNLLEAEGRRVCATELLKKIKINSRHSEYNGELHTAEFRATIKSLATLYWPQAPL